MFYKKNKSVLRNFGDVSLPLSMETLGHAVGRNTLDASRRECGVRAG